MSVRQLVDRIAEMGLVEDRVLQKIRREIDDPEKNVKPKGILNFLVKKEQITKAQAAKLLQEMEDVVEVTVEDDEPAQLDDIVVNVPEEKSYDTDDLTNLNPGQDDVEDVIEKVVVSPQMTRQDLQDVGDEIEEIVVNQNVAGQEELVEAVPEPAVPSYQADPLGAAAMLGDPLAGGGFDSAATNDPAAPTKTLSSFAGKRDNRDQWATKWLYIGFGVLGFLLIMGAVLYIAVGGQTIEELQKVAEESYQKRAYLDAVSKTEKLLESSPRHEKASAWRVRIVHCFLAAAWESSNYSEVLKLADKHLPDVCEEEAFGDLRGDLGIFLPGSALEVTQVAKSVDLSTSTEVLKEYLAIAENASAIVNDSRYLSGSIRKEAFVAKQIDEINDNVRRLRDAITKEEVYALTQGKIGELTDAGETDKAFREYNLLLRKYSDLGTREDLRTLMKAVSVKEVELVKDAEISISGETDDFESLVESQVVVARREGNAIGGLKGEVIPVLADGVLYGVDVGDGTILWNRFMGFEASYEPQWADPENHDELIVSDQRRHQVLKIKARDGSLIWRSDIGEEFCQPTVAVGKIFVSTYTGKIIGLDTATGDSFASAELPQKKLRVSPTASTRYPLLYQPGEYSNMYVMSTEDLSCREVVYVGHTPGSISAPVYEWSGYLLLPVNGADYCDVKVYMQSKDEGVDPGLGLFATQTVLRATTGHISTPLFRMGRRVLAVSDTGNLRLFELNKIDSEEAPLNAVSEQSFEVRKGDRNFVQAEGSRLWIAGKGVERYRLSQINEFKRQTMANPGDFFLGAVSRFDNTLVHVRRRANSAMTSISAVNDDSMTEIWRTDLGAAFAGSPRIVNGKVQVVSSQGDLFPVDEAAFRVGYTDRGVWSADVAEDYQFEQALDLDNGSYVCVGPAGRRDVLVVQPDGTTVLARLPMEAACPIVSFKDSILVASGKRGQMAILSPKTGGMKGNPFQPAKRAGVPTRWVTPSVLSDSMVIAGREEGIVYLLKADGQGLELVAEQELSGELVSGFVCQSNVAYAVVGNDESNVLTAWNTDGSLSEKASVKLESNLVAGPWVVGDSLLFTNEQGELVSFGLDLSGKRWSLPLNNDSLAGEPIVSGQSILLTLASGTMKVIDLGTGDVQKEVDFGQPVQHSPLFTTDKVFIGGADGRLLVLPRSAF